MTAETKIIQVTTIAIKYDLETSNLIYDIRNAFYVSTYSSSDICMRTATHKSLLGTQHTV